MFIDQIDIKTRPCNGRASCTCAVAVQYREVVVVLDACSGYMTQQLRPAGAQFPKGMRVTRHCGGRNCRGEVSYCTIPAGQKLIINLERESMYWGGAAAFWHK